jgi:hypothetical protein
VSSFLRGELPGDNGRSVLQKDRRRWPLSALCVVGVMAILNVVLGVSLIEAKLPKLRPAETASLPAPNVPRAIDGPAVKPRSELNQPKDQSFAPNLKSAPVRAIPVPRTRTPKPSVIAAKRPKPRPAPPAGIAAPSVTQSPAPVHEAASSPAAANPPSDVASIRTPGVGGQGRAEQPQTAHDPPVNGKGTSAKETSSSVAPKVARKVAPVRFPAIDKGWVPKMAVAPVSPKIEIVPRPPAPKPENCGGDVYVPCPTLHSRP